MPRQSIHPNVFHARPVKTAVVTRLSAKQLDTMIDKEARKRHGISGEEFCQRLFAGEYGECGQPDPCWLAWLRYGRRGERFKEKAAS